ncbi:MAG: hypothetical protein LBH84_01675, partial [Prevotellaceae bacterium]|nr:hypothetical protein [Prevotellaceae bacterium]
MKRRLLTFFDGTGFKLTAKKFNDGDDSGGDDSGETSGNGDESPDSGDGSEEDEDIEMSIDGLDGEQQLDEVLASHLPYDPKADL